MDNANIYLEKPATADERAIDRIMEELQKTINKKNISGLGTLFFDDAKIAITVTGPLIDKAKFMQSMSKIIHKIRIILYRNILIRVTGDNEAVASCVSNIFFYGNSFPSITSRFFRFKKKDSHWRISQAAYLRP